MENLPRFRVERLRGRLALVAAVLIPVSGGCSTALVGPDRTYTDGRHSYDLGFGGFDQAVGSPTPRFGDQVVTAAKPPPPITGGTLLLLEGGQTAVVADPDRDRIFLVDLVAGRVSAIVTLPDLDEPGRAVEDGAHTVHVVLRRGGAIARIDPKTGAVLSRRAVCAAPRGIAWDPTGDQIHVACAEGALVSYPAAGGPTSRTLSLPRDLRDVVVDGDTFYVSRFRKAEVLVLGRNGAMRALFKTTGLANDNIRFGESYFPDAAYRTILLPDHRVAVVHQRALADPVLGPGGAEGYYGENVASPCSSIVHGAVTVFSPDGSMESTGVLDGVLPVDLAFSPIDRKPHVVMAGEPFGLNRARLVSDDLSRSHPNDQLPCGSGRDEEWSELGPPGQDVALAWDARRGAWLLQTREPAALHWSLPGGANVIPLADDSRRDTGHDIFHADSGTGIACVSCHPEGLDDGRFWQFAGNTGRRTQALAGRLLGTEPFHWSGDLRALPDLVDLVYVHRMSGQALSPAQIGALGHWIDTIAVPNLPTPADPAAVQRGRALFNDPIVACATCHSGPQFTNRSIVDVGTGEAFKVPRLTGLLWRDPYMHDGCAATIADRFGDCGGARHGMTANLTDAQRRDLIAYLETL